MMQVFDAAPFWGSVSCLLLILLLILLVGCVAELIQRMLDRLHSRERAFRGEESCLDSTTDKGGRVSTWRFNLILVAGWLVAGLLCGWWLRSPGSLREPPAASQRQKDSSLVVERVDPSTKPAKSPHALPTGAVEERRVSVVVQPRRGVVKQSLTPVQDPEVARLVASNDHPAAAGKMIDSCDCPPVQVDLSLVRMPDHTRRVVASSPDGQVVSGIDVPSELLSVPRIPRWTASAVAVADLDGIRPGILLTRRLGPIVVGGGILSDPGLRRPGAIAQFGVTW